jgi:MFS family permease
VAHWFGYGTYASVGWALSIDVLPALEKAGRDLGVWNASSTLPPLLAPLLGGVMINTVAGAGHLLLGYQLVFAAATLCFLLAATGMLFVKK